MAEVKLQSSPELLGPGTQLSRYRIERFIGAGAMGTVYEATHVDLKKRVAFKALNPAVALDEEARKRFLYEGEVASRIRHPNVVEVFDVGIENDVPYLVMEFLEGESLSDLLAREAPLPPEQLASIMLPVLAAVATAHEEGVLHRDLKPDNIFIARSRRGELTPKLLDFGISKLTDAQEAKNLTGGGAVLGTPMYMSPEAATRAKQVDARSDQYALGVILYEASTGKDPFDGDTLYTLFQAIVAGRFAPPRSHRPDLPPAFEALICRAMSTEPEFRFPSVAALGRALLSFAPPRDCVIWGPAFEPKRTAGAPLTPSEFPSANDDLRALRGSFLDGDLWTPPDADAESNDDGPGVFRKPAALAGEPDARPAISAPPAPRLSGADLPPGVYAWDSRSEPTSPGLQLPPVDFDDEDVARPSQPRDSYTRPSSSRPSSPRHSISTLDEAAIERLSAAPSHKWPWVMAGGVLVLLSVGLGFFLSRSQRDGDAQDASRAAAASAPAIPANPTYRVVVATEPASAELLLDGVSVGFGRIDQQLPADGTEHVLLVRAAGHEPSEVRFKDQAPRSLIELLPKGISAEGATPAGPSPSVATTAAAPAPAPTPTVSEAVGDRPPAASTADRRRVSPPPAPGLGAVPRNQVDSRPPDSAQASAPVAAPVVAPRVVATANDAPILD